MFVDKNKLKEGQASDANGNPFAGENRYDYGTDKKVAFAFLAIIIVIAAAAAVFFFLQKTPSPNVGNNNPAEPGKPGQGGFLPGQSGTSSLDGFGANELGESLKAELIGFGDYYALPLADELAPYDGYSLPLDLKNEVNNYFYITRKFNLDPYIEALNQKGFVVIDNAFKSEANDFHALYRLLAQKEMPSVLTTDFILYYFQNELKNVYEEIEKNVFYDNLWKIYKDIYDVALARYKNRASSLGIANDTVLEAQRQEVTYLAVMLYTLKPTDAQISKPGSLLDSNKFNAEEVYEYNFSMPDEIKLDAETEIKLLREANKTVKSPTFLRQVNYANYKIPAHYSRNARLNNFYLAIKWLQTPWPLYYQSEECPDCELDYRDWLINMAAAAYLASDLGYDQSLKNKWAIIYKFVAFFTGLEKDLTYLNYLSAYKEEFGEDYSIAAIFADNNPDRDDQAARVQRNLADLSLQSLHGGKKRDQSEYRLIGMRLLQDFYWPNNFILNELVGTEFIAEREDLPADSKIACAQSSLQSYRCRGSGFDIVNILRDYDDLPEKYAYHRSFSNYQPKIGEIRQGLDRFNLHEWHESIYWTSLHLIGQYLEYDQRLYPAYNASPAWQAERDINTALGAWVNLHVPRDVLEYRAERVLGAFNTPLGCDRYNIIEPRPDLVNYLTSKSDMLIDILIALGVTKKTSIAAIQLREMNTLLLSLKKIMLKVQNKEALDDEDCKALNVFSTQYQVKEAVNKNFLINFPGNTRLNASNNGNRLMLLIYEAQGDLVVGFAPIFNYQESF